MGFADLVGHVAGDDRPPLPDGLVVANVPAADRAVAREALLDAIDRRATRAGVPGGVARQLCVLDAAEADLLVPGSGPAPPAELRAAYESLDTIVGALVRWFERGGTGADLVHLEERREAVERRVADLESRSAWLPAVRDLRPVERWVLARVAAARRSGRGVGPLPLLLDDPFRPVRGTRKTALLDLLGRVAAQCPLVYLTSDLDVVLWSRRREAATGRGPVVDAALEAARQSMDAVQSMRRSPLR